MFDQKWRQIYTVENAIVIYYENVELCALHISNYHNLIGERNSKQYLMPIHDIEQNRYSYFVSPKCFVWNARSFSWCHISVIPRFCIKNTMPLISIFERVRARNCIRGLSSGGAAVNNAASWRKTPIQNATLQTDNILFCTRLIIVDSFSSSIKSSALKNNLCILTKSNGKLPTNFVILSVRIEIGCGCQWNQE